MKQQVAQFFREALKIVVLDGLKDLVDFLNQHWLQRVEVLLLVPWASIRTPQPGHDFDESFEFLPRHLFLASGFFSVGPTGQPQLVHCLRQPP